MELFANVSRTYKTRDNAVKALAKVADMTKVRWFIVAAPDGRFIPCVHVGNGENMHLVHYGVCIVG